MPGFHGPSHWLATITGYSYKMLYSSYQDLNYYTQPCTQADIMHYMGNGIEFAGYQGIMTHAEIN